MATAEYVLVQIDIGTLFDNHVHLLDLRLKQVELSLEDRVDGEPNWIFFEDDDKDEPWTFMIQSLDVAHGQINAKIGELKPIDIAIPEFTVTGDTDGHLQVDGHGTVNDGRSHVRGRIGSLEELLGGGRIELDLDMMVDDTELSVSGSIGNLATLSGLDLTLTAFGPDADEFGEIFGMPEAFAEDVALKATIVPDDQGHTINVSGHVAQFSIETNSTVADLIKLDGVSGSVSLAGPDLGVFGKTLQITGSPGGPFQVNGTVHRQGGDLNLTDVHITSDHMELMLNVDFAQFPNLENAFGSLRISGPDISQFGALLRLDSLPVQPFQLDAALSNTGAELLTSSFAVGDHRLTAAGGVGEFPDFHDTHLTASLSGSDLSTLLGMFTDSATPDGAYQATAVIDVNAEGVTLSDTEINTREGSIKGSMHWQDMNNPGQFDLQGVLELKDLAVSGARFGLDGLPSAPLATRASLQADANEFQLLESSTQIQSIDITASGTLGNLRGIEGLDLIVEIKGSSLYELFGQTRLADDPPIAFSLNTGIRGRDESVELRGLELEAPGGRLQVDGTFTLLPGLVGSSAIVHGEGASLAKVLPKFAGYQPADNPWQIHAEIARPELNQFSVKDGRLEIGSINLMVSGTLDTGDHAGTEMSIAAHGDSIRDVGQFGEIALPDHPFNFTTDLEGTTDLITISHLDARWGESDLTGNGSINLSGKPKVRVKGRSEILDVIDLQHAVFGTPEDEDPADDRDRVIPDITITIDYLALWDSEWDIKVAEFHGQRSKLKDVDLALEARDGALLLERASWGDSIGHFNAQGTLRPDGEGVYMELTFSGADTDLGLFTTSEQPQETIPRYTLDVEVTGTGRTVAELAAAMNGTLLISSDGGQINNAQFDAFAGDFLANVLEVLNPFVQTEEFTHMECLVLNAAITDGQVNMEPGFVMRTDRVNMYVYGGVDLKTESLDLSFATQARRGIGISAASITNPYFKVGGNLASPALQLDPASAALAASVATATAGLSILFRGLWDRLMGAQNPCPTFQNYQRKPPKQAATKPG